MVSISGHSMCSTGPSDKNVAPSHPSSTFMTTSAGIPCLVCLVAVPRSILACHSNRRPRATSNLRGADMFDLWSRHIGCQLGLQVAARDQWPVWYTSPPNEHIYSSRLTSYPDNDIAYSKLGEQEKSGHHSRPRRYFWPLLLVLIALRLELSRWLQFRLLCNKPGVEVSVKSITCWTLG